MDNLGDITEIPLALPVSFYVRIVANFADPVVISKALFAKQVWFQAKVAPYQMANRMVIL